MEDAHSVDESNDSLPSKEQLYDELFERELKKSSEVAGHGQGHTFVIYLDEKGMPTDDSKSAVTLSCTMKVGRLIYDHEASQPTGFSSPQITDIHYFGSSDIYATLKNEHINRILIHPALDAMAKWNKKKLAESDAEFKKEPVQTGNVSASFLQKIKKLLGGR